MPKRNGKVERYQQPLKREWGLGQFYRDSDARHAALAAWLMPYNTTETTALDNRSPITRVRHQPRHNTLARTILKPAVPELPWRSHAEHT